MHPHGTFSDFPNESKNKTLLMNSIIPLRGQKIKIKSTAWTVHSRELPQLVLGWRRVWRVAGGSFLSWPFFGPEAPGLFMIDLIKLSFRLHQCGS